VTKPKGLSPEEEEAWRQRGRETVRRYREKHRAELADRQRLRRSADPEKYREQDRQRYAADLEKHREQHRKRARQQYAADPETFRQRQRQRRAADPEKSRERVRQRQDRVRDTVLGHYGRACACCGSTDRPTIDHIDGSGREHRAELFGGRQQAGVPFYDWLIREGFPPGFQTLCHPCNNSKGTGEYCRLNHATRSDQRV
jgi:hypothetical protein